MRETYQQRAFCSRITAAAAAAAAAGGEEGR